MVRLSNLARVQVAGLTAEITTMSLERMGLAEGDEAVATFKATGTRLVPLGRGGRDLDGRAGERFTLRSGDLADEDGFGQQHDACVHRDLARRRIPHVKFHRGLQPGVPVR